LSLLLGYFHTCIDAAFLNRKLVNLEQSSQDEKFFSWRGLGKKLLRTTEIAAHQLIPMV